MAFPTNDRVIRHGSSAALFIRLHVLGGPIGEPVAALQEMDIPHARSALPGNFLDTELRNLKSKSLQNAT